MNRYVQALLPKRVEDAQASVTHDSSSTNNLNFDLDNPFLLFQVILLVLPQNKLNFYEKILYMAK